ncbi:hypothetical protein RsoM2USA_307 [Ralstonia phage RsoM2USA]|nr:hypothetical protein RsoM2USA_307 [Ralstonia phage RsoM2USA]
MKLKEIQGLTKKQVEDFIDKNSIEFGMPVAFDVVNNKVVFKSLHVSASVYGAGPIKLPFEFDGLFSIEINGRIISNWSDVGSPTQAKEWYFINCEIPPIAQIPVFKHIQISMSPDVGFKDSIIPMFDNDSESTEFLLEDGPTSFLSVWKDKTASSTPGKIKVRYQQKTTFLDDTFELQDWLITNGFDNLV